MSLKDMSLNTGATLSVTGGTPLAFVDDGVQVPNGLHLVVPSDGTYQTRRQATVKFRPPTLDPKTGSYSKDKKSVCFTQPVVMSDGRIVFNTIRVEREVHPSTSAADCVELNKLGAQLLTDTDTANFWAVGSLS